MPWHERPWAAHGDHVALLRRRGWVVALAVLVVTGTALVVSVLRTPVYEARARVLAEPPSILSSSGGSSAEGESTETEAQILVSEPVQNLVRSRIGEAPAVEGVPIGDSQVLNVIAESTERARAAEVANAYATAYVDYRRQQTADRLLSATRELGAKVDDLTKQIDGLGTADPRRPALLSQLGVFRNQLDQLQVDAALVGGGPQVLVRASQPGEAVRPATGRNVAVALAVGLAFGLLLVLLLERLDQSIRTGADLRRAAPGVPVLGVVPGPRGDDGRVGPRLLGISAPGSPAAEAYRSIRTALRAAPGDRALRTVLVTSARDGESKSTTAANLAGALAGTGQDVVAVDCNLRHPQLHEVFGLSNKVGFTSVLSGEVPLSAALRKVPGEEHLGLLSSGPVPPNPSELLSSRRAVEVVAALAAQSDWVIADSPAVLEVTDATVLAREVDGVVLVVAAGTTTRADVTDALALLRPTEGRFVGVVIDGAARSRTGERPGSDGQRPPLRPASANGSGGGAGSAADAGRPERPSGTPG